LVEKGGVEYREVGEVLNKPSEKEKMIDCEIAH